jgi:uncharacterized sulfatase
MRFHRVGSRGWHRFAYNQDCWSATMKRSAVLTVTLVVLGTWLEVGGAESPRRPNVIVIFTDDHGYADLSCQGVLEDVQTPHIDALANSGVRMTSGYVTAPQCVPSRAGLLSGRYQNRFGVESNGMPLGGFNAVRTIAERLKETGYATGMVGKWHLGRADEIVQHGFDDVFYQGGSWINYDIEGRDVEPGTKFTKLYHLDAKSAAACAFIKRHHDQPFFLYLAYRAPHVPLDATPEYLKRFPGDMPQRRRQALAMLSAVDDGVGSIVGTLRHHDLEEQTLLFFIGDNGAPLKIHKLDAPGGGPGWDGSLNEPLNGEKGMLSEGGIRVPFAMAWKGKLPAGLMYDHPVVSLDVAATALAVAGLPHDEQLDGVNLIPFLCDEREGPPHRQLYWRWIAQSAVREGKWKLLRGGQREYLFDLSVDAEEKHNLLAEHPDVASRLRADLATWTEQLSPPGLQIRPMSSVWERYYDHYLDGKLQPKPLASGRGLQSGSHKVQDWLARGGTLKLDDCTLQARPLKGVGNKKRQANLFIVASSLELTTPLRAVVSMRVKASGNAGFAWRQKGQPDFPADQRIRFPCSATDQMQRYAVTIPASGTVIHLRMHLPAAGADIQSIELQDVDQHTQKRWDFGEGAK